MKLTLPKLRVCGNAREMGIQYGTHFRPMIRQFIDARMTAVAAYLDGIGTGAVDRLIAAGAECLDRTSVFDPQGVDEHHGIARGAQVDPVRLFTAANMTDVRDIIALPDAPPPAGDEGCTTALLPGDMCAGGTSLFGQTWDLNGPDMDFVIALHRMPTDGLETWTATCAGCQTLMGMNAAGIAVGTNNLKTRFSRIGVPYLSVLHKALAQASRQAASAVLQSAPVAGAHSYWVGTQQGGIEWERTPVSAFERDTADGPVARTNHCLFTDNREIEDALSESTIPRLERLTALVDERKPHTLETLKTMMGDRSEGRLSINRYAEDESGAVTNAVALFDPRQRVMSACRGQADRGEWVTLGFDR
ncbi:MAG: hypothetical protein JJ920_15270 [Roseitalea sp.]|jgi:isopenicillin-N N-acyltransferase-like protein|nr:hypothetical protein [Roseitalea sp.]MBO6721216.1 hypothetical protein [Roseitalea sp.]MBO6744274.1 hypothetical protein [Roseitalea sp.]